MNYKKIVLELHEKYPEKIIKLLPEQKPTEIICEITSTPQESFTIAIIEKSIPHYHKKSTEIYKVLKGSLLVHLNEQTICLEEGESCEIQPGTIHWAEGKDVWIECIATPGWKQEDHIIVIN